MSTAVINTFESPIDALFSYNGAERSGSIKAYVCDNAAGGVRATATVGDIDIDITQGKLKESFQKIVRAVLTNRTIESRTEVLLSEHSVEWDNADNATSSAVMIDPAIADLKRQRPDADTLAMQRTYTTVMHHLGRGQGSIDVKYHIGRNTQDTNVALYATFDTLGMPLDEQMEREEAADSQILADEKMQLASEYFVWVVV